MSDNVSLQAILLQTQQLQQQLLQHMAASSAPAPSNASLQMQQSAVQPCPTASAQSQQSLSASASNLQISRPRINISSQPAAAQLSSTAAASPASRPASCNNVVAEYQRLFQRTPRALGPADSNRQRHPAKKQKKHQLQMEETQNDDDLLQETNDRLSQIIACLTMANEQPHAKLRLIDEAHVDMRCALSYALHADIPAELCNSLRRLCRDLKSSWHNEFNAEANVNRQPVALAGGNGRPSFLIPEEQLLFFLEAGFNVPQIAKIFGVCVRTIRNRMTDYNVSIGDRYSQTSEDDLCKAISSVWTENPNLGVTMMKGALRSRKVFVTDARLRETMQRIGGTTSSRPCIRRITRRVYNISAPLEMFHIDGHHKLIRWRLVTHGGCDGYSRLIVYLRCSDNNRADTVLDCFKEGVAKYGLPACVRSDKGVENGQVCLFMLNQAQRGTTRSAFITGKSTHNQRIERMWADVFAGCIVSFQSLFYALEHEGCLDPLDEIDMWCLHHVFIPKINRSLQAFTDAWNEHRLRTEGFTPFQLFMSGLENIRHGSSRIASEFFDEDNYGVDWEGPVPEEDDEGLVVPETACPFPIVDLQRIVSAIEYPERDCNDLGRQCYIDVRNSFHSFLRV